MSVDVARVREALGVTQPELARLIGVNPMTVSRWERLTLEPHRYQLALLEAFEEAARRRPSKTKLAIENLEREGIARVLHALLDAAYG